MYEVFVFVNEEEDEKQATVKDEKWCWKRQKSGGRKGIKMNRSDLGVDYFKSEATKMVTLVIRPRHTIWGLFLPGHWFG